MSRRWGGRGRALLLKAADLMESRTNDFIKLMQEETGADSIAHVALNRPSVRNAVTLAMWQGRVSRAEEGAVVNCS